MGLSAGFAMTKKSAVGAAVVPFLFMCVVNFLQAANNVVAVADPVLLRQLLRFLFVGIHTSSGRVYGRDHAF
jgi:hypothetical protein